MQRRSARLVLRRRAQVDRIPEFEVKLQANISRLRALAYFTGGNPRLVLMLYRVVSQSDITEVRGRSHRMLLYRERERAAGSAIVTASSRLQGGSALYTVGIWRIPTVQ